MQTTSETLRRAELSLEGIQINSAGRKYRYVWEKVSVTFHPPNAPSFSWDALEAKVVYSDEVAL